MHFEFVSYNPEFHLQCNTGNTIYASQDHQDLSSLNEYLDYL